MGAQLKKIAGTETQSIGSRSNPERKTLGLVWITCPYPVVAQGLEDSLKEAQVHVGHEPPEGEMPSSIIFCSNETEDIALEVKRLREIAPHVPILIFVLQVDLQIGRAALQAGVSGFIHSGMQPAQIVNAVSLASAGEVVIPKELLRGLVEEETPTGTAALTSRQREILALVAEGLTNAQIAQRLHLSEFTIKQHLRHAYKLLKVRNRTEAARLWSSRKDSEESSKT